MDIRIPTDTAFARIAANPVTDLLAQLRAAGRVEAEVVRILQGQLLLSSRLGEILTSNTLHFKPGDRVVLRLDGSAQNPVLKASPAPARQINLDSRQNPDLAQALPPGRPMLARVIRIAARQAEIQLGEQVLKLPRPVVLVKNQLLSLRRDDSERRIELTPLDRKTIYKAIVKQLLPRQTVDKPTGLVTLLGLVNKIIAAADSKSRHSLATQAAGQAGKYSAPTPQVRDHTPNVATRPGATIDLARSQQTAVQAGNLRSLAAAVTDAGLRQNIAAYGEPAAARRAPRAARKDAGRPSPGSAGDRPLPTGGSRTAASGTGRAVAGTSVGITANGRPGQAGKATLDVASHSQPQAPGKATAAPVAASNRAAIPALASAISGATTSPAGSGALALLLQLLTRFPEVDAARVKHWFEFANLLKQPGADNTGATAPKAATLLALLADRETFGRELLRSVQHSTGTAIDAEAGAKTQPLPEALLLQIREGIKLVEQGLSQNLLQRAKLGLQQETQQPISLSLPVPLLDGNEVKPLYIDLAQRNQAQQESGKAWDIRLSFEFGDLGVVSCHVVLADLAIAASFYSEREQTRDRIDAALPQLSQQLSAAGFNPGELHSFAGRPVSARPTAAIDFSESLIDIEV